MQGKFNVYLEDVGIPAWKYVFPAGYDDEYLPWGQRRLSPHVAESQGLAIPAQPMLNSTNANRRSNLVELSYGTQPTETIAINPDCAQCSLSSDRHGLHNVVILNV